MLVLSQSEKGLTWTNIHISCLLQQVLLQEMTLQLVEQETSRVWGTE